MAGRPRTELGSWGTITYVSQVEQDGRWVTAPVDAKAQRWRARTRVRDLDGVVRQVERYAKTKARAERALIAVLRDRMTPRKGDMVRPDMSVVDAGAIWLRQVKRPDSNLSVNTIDQYADSFERYIEGSSVAGLTLREVNRVPVIRSFLEGVADERGSGSAKTARSVLSSILTLAVGDGVLDSNAARSVRPPKGMTPKDSPRDTSRALTRDERDELLTFVIADKKSHARDVVDLAHWMAGTGVRISEALDQLWGDVDLDAGTVLVRGTKTDMSIRALALPDWLLTRVRERKERLGVPASGLLFASPVTGRRRDRRNTARQLRDVFDRAGFDWMTPHTFRRTVASLIDNAGLPVALAADQLGHKDAAMTARVYLGRRGDMSKAAGVL